MDKVLPSDVSSLTAAGKTKKPIGVLPKLRITLGSLCLHIDCIITKATVLVGNDVLRMAGADILLSQSAACVHCESD